MPKPRLNEHVVIYNGRHVTSVNEVGDMADSVGNLSYRDVQSLDAAKLYYSGLTQEQVARQLNVARPTVSKLLAHAQRRGYVRIDVVDPREHDTFLIAQLQQRYGLVDVQLVTPPRHHEEMLRSDLGKAGARMIEALIRDGDTVGIVPSRTVIAMIDHLEPRTISNLHVVQLCRGLSGAMGENEQTLALHKFAHKYGAQIFPLDTPLVYTSVAAKRRVEAQPPVRDVLTLAHTARIAVYTVGDVHTDLPLLDRTCVTDRERELLSARAVGDICSRFVDECGRVCLPDMNNRTLGITLPQLRVKEQKILIAGGTKKIATVKAALETGYVNRLVTDVDTARAISASWA